MVRKASGLLCRGWVGGARLAARSPINRLLCEPLGRKATAKGLGLGNDFCYGFVRKIDGLLLGLGLAPEVPGSASGG